MPTSRKLWRWSILPLALVATLGLLGWVGSPSREAEPAQSAAQPSASPRTVPPAAPGAADPRSVAQVVRARNSESQKEGDQFLAAGWKMVQAPPPDPLLLGLDPALLNGREPELRTQMASSVASPAQAPKLAEITRRASLSETQVAAVEALGRVGGEAAQTELTSLLGTLPEGSAARREVAPLLHPRSLADPRAAELAQLLDSPSLDPAERKQIAFTLALVGLRDQSELPASALAGLSAQSRALLASMTSLARLAPALQQGSPSP